MPVNIKSNGQEQWVPGASVEEQVVPSEAGAQQAFQVPIIVGDAFEGHPYNADTAGKYQSESSYGPFMALYTDGAVRSYYGRSCDLAISAGYYKKFDGPYAYFCCASPLIRAAIIAATAAPVLQFTVFPRKWGAPGNYIKVKFATSIVTITPVRNFAMLSVNAGGTDTRIYLKGGSKYDKPTAWMYPGQTLTFGDNATAAFSTAKVLKVGEEFDANGQVKYYVDLTAAIGTAITTANYAIALEYDVNNTIVSPTFAAGAGQAMIDWFQASGQVLSAHVHADFTGALPAAIATATALKDVTAWGAVTLGTSPASTTADHTNITTALLSTAWNAFRSRYGQTPQAFLILSSDATNHATWNSFQVTSRQYARRPVPGWQAASVYTGCGFTDTSTTATNSTSPNWRGAQLNHQGFRLLAGQADRLAPYLSLASAFFGRRIGLGEGHDVTLDPLGTEMEITKVWDEENLSELTTLIKAGVITYQISDTTPVQYVFSAAVTTSQANRNVWDESTNATSVDMTRVLADRFNTEQRQLLSTEPFAGGDEVTDTQIAAVLKKKLDAWIKLGWIVSGRINSVALSSSGAGYDSRVSGLRFKVPNWFNNIVNEIIG